MQNFIEKQPLEFNKIRFLDIYMSNHKGFIAGGCFKNIFQNQKIKDVDIFFNSEIDFTEANIYYKSNEDYVFSYENKNTVSYKNKKTNVRIELIRNTYGTPQEIISKFDFSITKFCYAKKQVKDDENNTKTEYFVLMIDTFFEHLVNKKLVLEKEILYPISTFERSYRYNRYGFGLCKESKQNLIESLKVVNIEDISNELYFGID